MNAYGVAIELAVTGNAERKARELTVAFEALEKVLLNVERVLGMLRSPGNAMARAGANAATEWNRAAVAMERSAAAAKTAAGASSTAAKEARAAHGGMAALISGYIGYEGLKSTFNAEAKVRQAQTALSINGFSAAQTARGNQAAIAVQETNTGVTQVEALDILKTLQSITQNPDLAIAGLPSGAKYAPVFETLGLDAGKAIEAAFKGAEFRGELTTKDANGKEVFDQTRVDAFLKTAADMAIMSGGKVGPEALLTFLRQAGNAGAFASRDSLGALLPVLQSLGPSQAGTAMQAMDQQFSSGKMSDGGYRLGVEMGIFSRNPALARKVGMGQRQLLPGAMDPAAQELERTDKTSFVLDYLRPKIQAYNAKMYKALYTAGTSEADDQRRLAMDAATAQQLSSRIPGGKGIGDIVRNAPQVARDRAAYQERKKEGSPADKAIAENPEVQVKAFTAAWTAFEAAWGAAIIGPVTDALKAMTAALNGMADWARANPGLARLVSETAAGLIALSAAIYAVNRAIGAAEAITALGGAGGAGAAAGAAGVGLGLGAAIGAGAAAVAGAGVVGGANIASVLDPDKNMPRRPQDFPVYKGPAASPRVDPTGSGAKVQLQAYHPDQPLQIQGNLTLQDGTNLGRYTLKAVSKALSGTSGGPTGFDQRAGFSGAMPA